MTEFTYLKQLFDELWKQSDGISDYAFARNIYVKIGNNIEKKVHLLNTPYPFENEVLVVLENGPVLTNLKFDDLKSGVIKVKAKPNQEWWKYNKRSAEHGGSKKTKSKTKKLVSLFFKKKINKNKKTRKANKSNDFTSKTIYKKNDFNKNPYPNISLLKYRTVMMADNMVQVSSIKNKVLKNFLMDEYRKRLKILLKKHPKFKRKVKNVDKLSPTKLENSYFECLNLEK